MNTLKLREVPSPSWRRVFFDEADTIKISQTCELPKANMTWYISSSWQNLLLANHHYHSYLIRQITPEFLQGLCQELQEFVQKTVERHPTVLFFRVQSLLFFKQHLDSKHPLRPYLVVRSDPSLLQESLQLPQIEEIIIRCRQPVNRFDSEIPPQIEPMLHAGDIQLALQTLGIPQHTPTTIVGAVTEFYRRELETLKRQNSEDDKERIHRLEAKIQGIQQRLEQASKEVCAICYDPPENPVLTPCCSKLFCGQCMLSWMLRTSSCPLCRDPIHPSELTHIGSAMLPGPPQLPKKQDALLRILKETPDGKFIVFSKYDNPLLDIQHSFEQHFPCQTLQGNKDSIGKQLAAFEEGNIKLLLLNSRFAAAGLNIPSATHLILYHDMGSEEEKQIIGRAQRLGRTTPLKYIKLLHPRE